MKSSKKAPPFPFKSHQSQIAYRTAYDRMLAHWSVPVEPLDVPTRLGQTHINVCGPKNAPALLLLHGFNVSSTMWAPIVGPLSRKFRIYALDIIGDIGLSIPCRPLYSITPFMEWLRDLFDALRLEKAHLVGLSFGGWLAANFALHAPQRVNKIGLLAPGGTLLSINPVFLLQTVPVGLFANSYFTHRFFKWASLHQRIDDALYHDQFEAMIDQAAVGESCFRQCIRVIPSKMSDTQLRHITAPTLLLIGEQEVIYNPVKAINRAKWLIPNLRAELLPNACHDLVFAQSKLINHYLLEFLL
ncbi:MAG: alpha/beta hydrolase [Anaerolineae bacterium]|nr:alpha/beta hydrolase [Anaerolineae bacterium]